MRRGVPCDIRGPFTVVRDGEGWELWGGGCVGGGGGLVLDLLSGGLRRSRTRAFYITAGSITEINCPEIPVFIFYVPKFVTFNNMLSFEP